MEGGGGGGVIEDSGNKITRKVDSGNKMPYVPDALYLQRGPFEVIES